MSSFTIHNNLIKSQKNDKNEDDSYIISYPEFVSCELYIKCPIFKNRKKRF
jgi:hypothetical protein